MYVFSFYSLLRIFDKISYEQQSTTLMKMLVTTSAYCKRQDSLILQSGSSYGYMPLISNCDNKPSI